MTIFPVSSIFFAVWSRTFRFRHTRNRIWTYFSV